MGWPDHLIFGQGVAGHPIPAVWGWPKPPQAFGGGPATSKGQKKKKKKKKEKWVLAFGGGRTTPKGLGWLRPPPYGRYGVAEATPWPKMGWSGHPIFWARGGSNHPDFFLFFFFFFFNFLLFFKKKKKKNPKICKTTPFCPKRLRFGRTQNGVVLEWRV
jgi:hypothetical protein